MKKVNKCPYCGNDEEVYVKKAFKGSCNYYYGFNGEEAYNGEMYDCLETQYISNYVYCSKCDKKLFKVSEIEKDD